MSNGNNTGITIVAERYATAMIELAEKNNQLSEYNTDLQLIKNTIASSKELELFLTHPTVSINDKKEIIDKLFRDKISLNVLNLLKLLLDKNRIFIFQSIANHYHDILNKMRNITVANVVTAINIDEETINRVKTKLEELLKQSVEIEASIDPDIIAGMVVKIGDRIIDGSIRNKLETMKKQLI